MLDDSILNHPIMDREFESEEDFYNIESILAEAGITMPEKFTWEPAKEIETIFYKPHPDGLNFECPTLGSLYQDIEDAYSAIHKKGMDVKFDESVLQVEGIKKGFLGGVEKKVKGGWRMMFEASDPRPLDFSNYFSFLKLAKSWVADQDNWVLAYNFIQYHPMFWSIHDLKTHPFTWKTEHGHSSLWVMVGSDKGKPVVMLEGGSSVPPHHNHHYHDHKLDVWGENFEDAYIKFAKNIHRDYSLDGLFRADCTSEEK